MEKQTPIAIVPISPEMHRETCQLIASSFRDKFQALLPVDELRLAEALAACVPDKNGAEMRMVALMDGNIVGSIGLTRAGGMANAGTRWRLALDGLRREHGVWRACKFAVGMALLHYKPQFHECYIDHIAVRASHRNLGIGSNLLVWAKRYVRDCPDLGRLTLHVAGSNKGAVLLYERHGFATIREMSSMWSGMLLKESHWRYMAWDAHESEVWE
ncbi:GNAT family N-acetyltransferase [Paenibacillus aurantiacus]|uniref:GNAT family N-acetyltransferase n=1 Tax=Paenibacillus aurantiacus TaxID=1936118 RepID=A0ABV5KXM6_9BACL